MAAERPLTSDEFERLIHGVAPADRDDLVVVAKVFQDLRASVAAEPVPVMGTELADLLSENVIDLRDRPRSRRRSTITGVTIGLFALVGATGVAAASDALPGPLQGWVADGASVFGVDVPDGRGHAGEDPQPEHGNDVKGHDPKGPPADKPGATPATPADPGEKGDGSTPATPASPPEQSNQPDDVGPPADPGSQGNRPS